MAQSPLDVWTAIVSQATPTTLEKLSKFVDFAEPPEFFDYAQTQWNLQQQRNPDSTWELLVDGQLIFSAVGHPSVLNLKEATVLARIAMTGDPLFTTKLLRRLLANRIWPEEVPADEMLRALSILEALEDPQRLAMTLLKFSKFPCRMVQSKVAKLLGRVSDSIDVLEELFQVPDARVRANLLQGIAQRDDLEPFRAMIDRGCKDQNTRVSAFALAIKARTGHGGSKALLKMRLNAKTGDVRDVAHFASSIVGLADLVGGAEPAVAPAVAEVHEQAESHPDK